MVTKKHCDYCDKEVESQLNFPCKMGFGWNSQLDSEYIECCSDECFLRELKKRLDMYCDFTIEIKENKR